MNSLRFVLTKVILIRVAIEGLAACESWLVKVLRT